MIGLDPQGLNFNDVYGSTNLENLQSAVVSHGAVWASPTMGPTDTGLWTTLAALLYDHR
jgi:hypothetical protein